MIPKADPEFWACFDRLPQGVKEIAREKFRMGQQDPFYPSLHFKQVLSGIWSARVNMQYRALARQHGDIIFGSGSGLMRNMIVSLAHNGDCARPGRSA